MSPLMMPSQQDLEKLSFRAMLTYAAKCARRMQPMYDAPPDVPNRHELIAALDQAITVSEQYLTGGVQLPPYQYHDRFDYGYEVRKFVGKVAETTRMAAKAASGTAVDAAAIAGLLVKGIADILNVTVEEDPNAASIYNDAIMSNSWDGAQDIVARETKYTRAAREADAQAIRMALAIETTSEIIRIASLHIEADLLISDYELVMKHLQNQEA